MSNLVSPEWVNTKLNDDHVVILDCRFSLADPAKGYEQYKQDHITGAYYADLEKHLSGPVLSHGGRHPLPSVNILSQFLSRCGVDSEKIIVAYDDQSGAFASRLWWLLKYLGHDQVFVMQGGYTHYKEKGYATSSKMPKERDAEFIPNVNDQMVAFKDSVMSVMNQVKTEIIDAREPIRYKGIKEPIDHKAGHIPTAINIPWESHFVSPGWWKEKNELEKMYKDLMNHSHHIVYCGSGVTACVNVLAMHELGMKKTVLYAGSWSDWISHKEHEIETN
ncbi:sulfurtransferase [Fictibacillus nanhaiensis]|uniref:sulfurtransferase n=1 Tax=Fictibacillus nanhaiensis TaxID=742169 RepID=UPI001C976D78|nr:sulfurtransferase [Fictibacillus nanhaiensis]MBY6035920.1 sulfurtransferase [Fictibacillus nanhaiensis]